MIRAMVFDPSTGSGHRLDGTLVQTERLKALSYARAAVELCPHALGEVEVVEAFKAVVGLPRREVAQALVEQFDLEKKSWARMAEFGVSAPWQAFVQVRLRIYEAMLVGPEVLRSNQWPHNVALLRMAQQTGCQTALAAWRMEDGGWRMCEQARRVLEVLELAEAFRLSRDAGRRGTRQARPRDLPTLRQAQDTARSAGTGYPPGRLPGHRATVAAQADSPSGVKAALAAGMWCIAVATPFTRQRIHAEQLLDERWIVDDPTTLMAVVGQMVAEQNTDRQD